jgi:hypothetical protein
MRIFTGSYYHLIKYSFALAGSALLLYGGLCFADDDVSKFTNAGSIGLTITNFGTIGHGFTLWPGQPSCEYPKGSGIEHLFDGGIWVGGIKNGVQRVSTGSYRCVCFKPRRRI